LKFAISFAIPDTPHEVQIAKAKNLYESNQALRREVSLNSHSVRDHYAFPFSVNEKL
jgi:hypothetical protein